MTDTTDKEQKPHLYKKGQSGNPKGRPKGTKNKLSADFINALAADFERYGLYPIARTRRNDPAAYLRTIVALVPKEFIGHVDHEHSHTVVAVSEVDKLLEDFATGIETSDGAKALPN